MDDMVLKLLKNQDYVTLFKLKNITNLADIIDTIERYNIIDTETLITRIRQYELFEDKYISNPKEISRESLYSDIEDEHGVLIETISSNSLMIYIPLFSKVELDELAMSLNYLFTENGVNSEDIVYNYSYITPFTYKRLTGEILTEHDYDIRTILRVLVIDCIEQGGSDLHIETRHIDGEACYRVRYRVDGTMITNERWKLTKPLMELLCYNTIAEETSAQENKLGTIGIETVISDLLEDGKYQIRICIIPVLDGSKFTARIQSLKTVSFNIDQLGFDKDVSSGLKDLAKFRQGITLITGPVRSGKNTTTMAMTNSMDRDDIVIQDLSSPVEILMDFSQYDYGENINNLVTILKRIKKLDIDIVTLNEIPSKDVAFGVLELAQSSIGAITTTHLNRIWMLPHKLYSYFGQDYKDVLSYMNGVLTQKLYPKLCPHCTEIKSIDVVDSDLIKRYLREHKVSNIYIPSGNCTHCRNGRLSSELRPYGELLIFNDEIRTDLRKCDSPYEMEEYLKSMIKNTEKSLDYKVSKAINNGDLYYEEVLTLI